jgi:hypothetical protein
MRRIGAVSTVALLVAAALVLMAWVLSLFCSLSVDRLDVSHSRRASHEDTCAIVSGRLYWIDTVWPPDGPDDYHLWWVLTPTGAYGDTALRLFPGWGVGRTEGFVGGCWSSGYTCLGFVYQRGAEPGKRAFDVAVPLWFLATLLLIPPALRLRGRLRAGRRAAQGNCVKCGYDLRGSPSQCPECGTHAIAVRYQAVRAAAVVTAGFCAICLWLAAVAGILLAGSWHLGPFAKRGVGWPGLERRVDCWFITEGSIYWRTELHPSRPQATGAAPLNWQTGLCSPFSNNTIELGRSDPNPAVPQWASAAIQPPVPWPAVDQFRFLGSTFQAEELDDGGYSRALSVPLAFFVVLFLAWPVWFGASRLIWRRPELSGRRAPPSLPAPGSV